MINRLKQVVHCYPVNMNLSFIKCLMQYRIFKCLFLLLSISFFTYIPSAEANSLEQYYLNESYGVICFGSDIINDLFDVKVKQTALTNFFNLYKDVVKERFGIDLIKDVENVGFFLVLKDNKIKPIGFLSGNFNLKEILPIIKENIASEPELLEEIDSNGKKVKVLQIEQNKFVFQNDNLIWFCNEYDLKNYNNKPLFFSAAPVNIKSLTNKSNNFINIDKKLWGKLFCFKQSNITIDFDSVSSVSCYMKDWNIIFEANLDSMESAEVLKLQLEYYFNNFKDQKDCLSFDESLSNIFKQINSLYFSARIIDIINSLKLEVKDNTLVVLFPYDKTNFYNAISDFIMNVAVPSYHNIVEEARIPACYYTQHLITKAIEKFNNENEPMMTSYSNLKLSVDGYLPYSYDFGSGFMNKSECVYTSVGNLADGGYIVCGRHGPAIPLIKPQYSNERKEANECLRKCHQNIRTITNAVEYYNIDNNYSMSTNLDLSKLEGYIKGEIKKPSLECEYYIKGNLSGDGKIACKKHDTLLNNYEY